jgi:N-acetylglucosaminyldiphosphoundecaprenol N-acetyl-beta-D-mannosaminyltransferase
MESRRIVSVRVDATSYEEVSNQVARWAIDAQSRYVCACNVHMVMEAHDDPTFRDAVDGADLVTPDGMPLVWALRAMGVRDATRVYGPSLMLALCEGAERHGISIGLYGSTDVVLKRLVERLAARFPRLHLAYAYSPPFTDHADASRAHLHDIRAAGVRILFVALGCPKQERWMARNRGQLPAVMVGVGAAFDFVANTKRQAPGALQKVGLEWLFRLATEPRRLWRRYALNNPRFVVLLAKQLIDKRRELQTRRGVATCKERLKATPGIGPFLRWTRLVSPGGWIFTSSCLEWLRDPALRGQLPLTVRTFSLYVRPWLRLFGTERHYHIPGAIQLFAVLMWVRGITGRPPIHTVKIDGRNVTIKVPDPRSLAVINEQVSPGPPLQAVMRLLRPGDTFLDIGANHGTFAMAAAQIVGPTGTVIAFEPQPDLARLVEINLAEIPVGVSRVHQVALGDRNGEVLIWVPRDSSGCGTLTRPRGRWTRTVSTSVRLQTLDRALDDALLTGQMVIKLDVEGHETAVLRGGTRTLQNHRPAIICEVDGALMATAGFTVEHFRAAAARAGYSMFKGVERGAVPMPVSELRDGGHRDIVLFRPDCPLGERLAELAI